MFWQKPKILIVKLAAIGDVVMSLAMLPYLRKKYPDASITWLCGKKVASLIEKTGLVNAVIAVDEEKLLAGNLWQKLGALIKIWIRFAGKKFDLVLIAHPDPRYRWLSVFVRAAERRFLEPRGKRKAFVPSRYHGSEYVRLAAGIDEGPHDFQAHLPAMHISLKPEISRLFQPGKKRIAVAPGGAKNVLAENAQRRWPIENYAEVIQHFAERGFQVIVTGASSDLWVLPHFPEDCFVNLVGKLDLLDLIALYGACDLLITHDSGPLHLAKLAKCEVIALFGPTNPAEFVSSTDEKVNVLWGGENLSCRPCYDGRFFAKCTNNQCLQSISVETVVSQAEKKLQQGTLCFETRIY